MKYQEALDIIRDVNADSECLDYLHKFGEAILTLEELVEKETPKKVIKGKTSPAKCPHCDFIAEIRFDKPHDDEWYHFTYCPRCRVKLNWGNEE